MVALLQDSNLSIAESTSAGFYAARDTELDRPVALKFLRAEALDPRWTPARFLREAKATSALNHPNIVTVHEIIHSPEGLVIAMELIEGASLRAHCRTPQPAQEVARHGLQIAKALAAAHSRGVMHRDIKPENIMLRTDGYVKVVDFGLAREFAQLDGTESAAGIPSGTLRYMSPEQTGGKRLTTATDVFSLGIVLYELACAVHPFAAETAIETAYKITHHPPAPLPASVPPALEKVLLRLLAKPPDQRPSASEAADLLEAVLTPRAAPAPPRRMLALMGAGAALILAGVVAVRILSNSPSASASPEPLNIVNVTSLEGYEWGTSFSPDGRQIAFAWDGGPARQQGIYTQPVAGGAPAQISRSPGEDFYPSWSPDGTRIAFVRRIGKGPGLSVLVAPATGGPAQNVTGITDNEGYAYPVAWHPDGNSLLIRTLDQRSRISILRHPLDGGPRTSITAADSPTWDGLPTPSPNGRRLAFSRSSHGNRFQVCVQDLSPTEAKCFASAGSSLTGLAWAEGERSVYVGRAKSLIRLDLVTGVETKAGDGLFSYLAGDRLGRQFAFTYTHRDHNIWRFPTEKGQFPAKWIASSDDDIEPAYSPDGQSLVFRSKRSGVWEFWICRADGSGVRQLTSLKGSAESPRWSPNGRQIALWGNAPADRFERIYLADVNSGDLHPLTPDLWPAQYPIWSAGGDSILFTGGDPTGIWSIPIQGTGAAVRIASTTWLDAFLSGDRQWIYFTKGYDTPGVWRMPVSGGREPELIAGSQGIVNYRYWDVAGDTAYFADIGGGTVVVRSLDLKTGQSRPLFPLRAELFLGPRGLAVSGDGKSILMVKLDTVIGDIRMIDGLK